MNRFPHFRCLFALALVVFAPFPLSAQLTQFKVTQEWIAEHLQPKRPRLIFTQEKEAVLRQQLRENPAVKIIYNNIKKRADEWLTAPPLTREMDGRRMLGTSREALRRTTTLAMLYSWSQARCRILR
ncbi:MAG: hypothetical protein HC842_08850 [Cytophagales bacterium]|nr:hypothetical protein [Cytophagales bacterium]